MSSSSDSKRPARTVRHFRDMKERGEKIVVMTAYDFLFARVVADAGVDMILVGDSLGQVVLGYGSTIPVTLDEMIHHASAVRRGAPDTFTVLDMPFLSYQVSADEALRNAGRVFKEVEVEAVKLEGGAPRIRETTSRLVEAGIPVMGHLGLTPQSVHALGGYRVQGREKADARRLLDEARALEDAGCFALVLELLPRELALEISEALAIPTIGIGAGPGTDGQVLVLYDALGLNRGFEPRFLKRFADLYDRARDGIRDFAREVRDGTYPGPDHSFSSDD